jgi:Oxidoreductase family, C-terminal alpha/beta domain
MSTGGRSALEYDGETPDLQDATWVFPGANGEPGFLLSCTLREACSGPRDARGSGQTYYGTKGVMSLAGRYRIVSETKTDPANDIPRFQGHPPGGPVYSNIRPTPWLPEYADTTAGPGQGPGRSPAPGGAPGAGGVASDARYGLGGEDTLLMNERDWLNSMRTRQRPLCGVEDGHRVAIVCNLANMSLRLGRAIRWDPDKEQVIGDEEAKAMCVRPYRAPWDAVLQSIVRV